MISPVGAARKLLDLSIVGKVALFGNDASFQEFYEKIRMPRLRKYLNRQYFSPEKIIMDYNVIINQINTYDILKEQNIVLRDRDDNEYLKIAIASQSRIIVTRDKDLLDIKEFGDIKIVNLENFLKAWYKSNNGKLF